MMETQRNKKKSHRSTDGTPRSDGPTTHDGEEQTSLSSTTSADEGTTPDGVKNRKASSRQLQLKLGSKIKIATWNVRFTKKYVGGQTSKRYSRGREKQH